MNRNLFATCILALAFAGAASAQGAASSAETGAHYTKAQVKELKRTAHAPAQCAVLASYYGAQYPRPVDSARNLYEYYLYKASKAETLQAQYSQLATPSTPVNAE